MIWYYESNSQPAGPISKIEVDQLIAQGMIRPQTRVWREGMQDWLPAELTAEFTGTFIPAPTQVAETEQPTNYPSPETEPQSPFAAGAVPTYEASSPFAPPQTYSQPSFGGGDYPSYGIGGPEEVTSIESYYRGFIISIVASIIAIPLLIGTIIAGIAFQSAYIFIVVGILCLLFFALWIFMLVCQFALIYKLWSVIPPERAKTTPGMAIGFMFIPLFNIYWIFIVYYVLSQNMNDVLQSQGRPRSVNETIPLVYCITVVASCMAYIGILPAMVSLVFYFLMFNELIQGVKTILNIPQE